MDTLVCDLAVSRSI